MIGGFSIFQIFVFTLLGHEVFSAHHKSRSLIADTATPSAVCPNICNPGANWYFVLVPETITINYAQDTSTLAIINLSTSRALFFSGDSNGLVLVDLSSGQAAAVKNGLLIGFSFPESVAILGAPTNYQVLNFLSPKIILAINSVNQQTSSSEDAIISDVLKPLPAPIQQSLKDLILRLKRTPTGIIDGPQLYVYFFNDISLMNGVKSGQITTVTLQNDNSFTAGNGGTTSLFSISPNGKIIQNYRVVGKLNAQQKSIQVLPGGIIASGPPLVQTWFESSPPPASNLLSPVLQGLGTGLGLEGVIKPVDSLLTNVLGLVGLGK